MSIVDTVAGPLFLRNLRALGDYVPDRCGRTLTIVALAIRQAEHIAEQMRNDAV